MMFRCLLLSALTATSVAAEASYTFRWTGDNGYTVDGALSFDAALRGRIIRETDLTCFAITARKGAEVVGTWSLGALDLDTTWRLHFDSLNSAFLVEGDGVRMPQAWNMNGRGDNCGKDGFGLNIGNIAQDICLDGRLITDSQIAPGTPFPAQPATDHSFPATACIGPDLLG